MEKQPFLHEVFWLGNITENNFRLISGPSAGQAVAKWAGNPVPDTVWFGPHLVRCLWHGDDKRSADLVVLTLREWWNLKPGEDLSVREVAQRVADADIAAGALEPACAVPVASVVDMLS